MDKRRDIATLEKEIVELKNLLVAKENALRTIKNEDQKNNPYCNGLNQEEISRYSRQMIMSQITVAGQIKLKNSHILVVGVGGLGCPASLYLAAAGVGNITLLDNDIVELSNLHRQILHTEFNLGISKVDSARYRLNQLNANVKVQTLQMHLDSSNISGLLKKYDAVIDGTDNVATRYLLNDACVLQNKPLVSGSALQFEGQLTVYHHQGGPCYRCLFPQPPPPETVTSCGDGGVLGAVPGCIGVLQALETIKILLRLPDVLSGRMLLFDGASCSFRNVVLRKRNPLCEVCGYNPIITAPIDYEAFCQANAHDKGNMISLLSSHERASVSDFDSVVKNKVKHILLDVRPEAEFGMCRLPNSVNIPFIRIQNNLHLNQMHELIAGQDTPVYVICRRGNDSQRAVQILRDQFRNVPFQFKDIIGGLHAYSAKIDSRFPAY